MALWFTASAASPVLQELWGLTASRTGWLTTIVQFGFVAGTLTAALFNLADILPLRWYFTIAVVQGSNRALWQIKVPPELQGRVFAAEQMMARAFAPLAYLLAGPLADRVFEPLLAAEGALAGDLGPILGTGPGRGIGLMFLLIGLTKVLIAAAARGNRHIREIEDDLPDATPSDQRLMDGAHI